MVSEVISILMEIRVDSLSPVLWVQCPCDNAFPVTAALLCEYPFRLPAHNVLLLLELSQQDITTDRQIEAVMA